MAISIFTVLCNHHHFLTPDRFHYPKKKPYVHQTVTPHPLFPSAPGSTNLLSEAVNFAYSGYFV